MADGVIGGGVGTPVSPGSTIIGGVNVGSSAIPLCQYPAITGADECGFWGVRYDGQGNAACGYIWRKYQRDRLMSALAQAQESIENLLNYPLVPKFVEDRQVWGNPVLTKYARIIDFGRPVSYVIESGIAVDYNTEPATIGPFVIPDSAEPTELVVQHLDGSTVCIESMEVSGNFVTLYIPRCRLVNPDQADNPKEGWDYNDLDNFASTVNVHWHTVDTTVQAKAVFPNACTCTEDQHEACPQIVHQSVGIVDIRPLTWDDAAQRWKVAHWCGQPRFVDLYYRAGLLQPNSTLMNAVVRLAHTKLPAEPCGCEVVNQLWKQDMDRPEFVSFEQARCPFGDSDGAWYAYTQVMARRALRMSVFNSRQPRTNGYSTR